jgi:hypothetical protein
MSVRRFVGREAQRVSRRHFVNSTFCFPPSSFILCRQACPTVRTFAKLRPLSEAFHGSIFHGEGEAELAAINSAADA